MTNDQLDQHLDNILRAAWLSGLKYVPWMTKEAIDNMRNALRVAITAKLAEALRDRLALMDKIRNHPPMHSDSYHQALAETEEAMRSALAEYDKRKGNAL